jgi:hypothetical protein
MGSVISGVVSVEVRGAFVRLGRFATPRNNILEGSKANVCSLMHTFAFRFAEWSVITMVARTFQNVQ